MPFSHAALLLPLRLLPLLLLPAAAADPPPLPEGCSSEPPEAQGPACVKGYDAGYASGMLRGQACSLWWLELESEGLPHEATSWSTKRALQCCYWSGGQAGFSAGLAHGGFAAC